MAILLAENSMGNSETLKLHAWRPGQSGNVRGRPPGPSLKTRLKRRDRAAAFAALDRALASKSEAVALAAFKVWAELYYPPGTRQDDADQEKYEARERARAETQEALKGLSNEELVAIVRGEKSAEASRPPAAEVD